MSARALAVLVPLAALALAGCSAVRLEPREPLPPPLIDRLPVAVAVSFPQEFRDYAHKEKRQGVDYEVLLGPAHVERFEALLGAMFDRVVQVPEPAAAATLDPPVRLVVEPRFEEYAFLTPSDVAGDYYTVTIRYRVDLYAPSGERADAYVFTGFGRERSSAFSGTEPLARATQRAMRDAGAKFAIEFTEQPSVRRLLDMGGMEMLPVGGQLPGGTASAESGGALPPPGAPSGAGVSEPAGGASGPASPPAAGPAGTSAPGDEEAPGGGEPSPAAPPAPPERDS
jgi:hypothetical protein